MLWKARTNSSLTVSSLVLGACFTGATLLAGTVGSRVAQADSAPSTSVTTPSSTVLKAYGLRTAVVAATDTGGDAEVALRALKAAHIALARSTGYRVMPADQVARSLQKAGTRWPFAPRQYPDVRKALGKADRALAVTVSPGTGGAASYSAVVELYDLNTGGLVGRGESSYTASADTIPLVTDATLAPVVSAPASSEPVLGSFPVPAGTAGEAPEVDAATTEEVAPATAETVAVPAIDTRFLAVDGAVLRAVEQMNEPAEVTGIIVSLPGGYTARLSKGEMHGLRNGARIEYTVRGRTIAYGTAVDVGKGEALATVAPERAFPLLELNGEFRTVSNPARGAAGRTRQEIDDKEFRRFETEFGLGLGIAGLAYLLFIN